jgi:small-conductance mechanosensitive channel
MIRAAALACLLLLGAAPARAADAVWEGSWDTRWPDGSARIELHQHGDAVDGIYRIYDRHLTGRATGNTLEGEWREGTRRGHFTFVLGPFGQGFAGRFDGDAWWTGQRTSTSEIRAEIRTETPKQALRSFVVAANCAVAGFPEAWADAAGLIDFGADAAALDGRARVARTRALFDAIDLTTFSIWALPDPPPEQDRVSWSLHQSGTDATLDLTMLQRPDGQWRIAAPAPDALAAATRALLVRTGGRAAAPDAMLTQRTPRDTMRAFVDAMQHWDAGGAQRVLETMDLSQIRAGYRTDQGELQAQYMMQVINRVGAWQWQEIPDDPASREPYVFFTHPAGQIVIAPQGDGEQTRWRFTAASVDSQLRLFVTTADMPVIWGMPVFAPAGSLFAFRQRVAAVSPRMLERSVIPALENWQIAAIVAAFAFAVFAVMILVPLAIRLFGVLMGVLGQTMDARLARRLVWPLRLIVLALIWYRFSRRLGIAGPFLPVLDSAMGVIAAVGVAWAGLPVVDAIASGMNKRAARTAGTMDDIMVSLTAGVLKLVLVIAVALAAAQAADVPIGGMLAGLGIGGLAVAFASKEALSNLFGAGILLADRPFRNGDTIAVGDVQGTVEHVGIRSTRIRTMDDTVIVLPNGKLSDALINNYGARRYRLFRTKFAVGYGATPEQLEAFTLRLREMIDTHPSTAEEKTQVGIWELGDEGVAIDLVCYFRAETTEQERAARHQLLLQVMRLAQECGVTFSTIAT